MSLTKTLHPDEKYKAGKIGQTMTKAGLGIGVLALGISIVLTIMSEPSVAAGHTSKWSRFLHAYVVGWTYIFGISMGAIWITILHHLVRGRWLTAVRRITEAMGLAMPIVFLAGLGFIIPLLAGHQDLYYWAHPDAHNHVVNHHLAHKLGWLSPEQFAVRYVIYGVAMSFLAHYFAKKSKEQDASGDPKISETLRIASAPAMILFSLVVCMVSFDVLMSLAPKWYSTIYGVSYWGGSMVSSMAALALIVLGIQRSGRLTHSVNENHYHDIGKWMVSFTFFWAYTAFAQFMLQWYGNMPEETVWYKYRLFGEWQWVSIALLVGFWAFPFVFLMSRWTKRIVPSLVFFAVWQLVFRWLELYWEAMPNFDWHVENGINVGPLHGNVALHHVGFSPVDLLVWIGLCGILVAGIGKNLVGNLIPVKDPTLPLSLGHENQ